MKKNRHDSFTESTIYLVMVKALSFLPLLLLPLLARSESSLIFSQVMLALTIDRFLFVVYEFGSHLPNISRISYIMKSQNTHDESNTVSVIFTEVKLLRLSLWLAVCGLSFLVLTIFELASINRYFLLICLISGLFRALSPLWLFQAVRRLRYQLFIALLSKIVFFAGTAYLFYTDSLTGFGYLLLYAFSDFLGLALGFIFYFSNNFRIVKSTLLSFKNTAHESVSYFLGRLSSAGYNSLGPILLGVVNPASFALYSISERILVGLQSINAPIMDSLFAHRISDTWNVFRFALTIVFFCSSSISFLFYYFADEIILILFGVEFIGAALVLKVLCAAFVVQSLSSILGHPFLTLKGYGHITNHSVSFGFVISLILLVTLGLNQSLISISLAYLLLLTELTVLIYRVIFIFLKRSIIFSNL